MHPHFAYGMLCSYQSKWCIGKKLHVCNSSFSTEKNCNEFAHDGIEIKAIEDNTNKQEIATEIEEIIMNINQYSQNCRNQFLKSFYYRVYNRQFADLVK